MEPKKIPYRVHLGDGSDWIWDHEINLDDRSTGGFVRAGSYAGTEEVNLADDILGDKWQSEGWRDKLENAYTNWKAAQQALNRAASVQSHGAKVIVPPIDGNLIEAEQMARRIFREIGAKIEWLVSP